MSRSPKRSDLLAAVRQAAQRGDYVLTKHARKRLAQRKITLPELLQVLASGRHEKAKDEFVERFQAWNYAIRGKTVDKRELRVAVGFDPILLIITVIDLESRGNHEN